MGMHIDETRCYNQPRRINDFIGFRFRKVAYAYDLIFYYTYIPIKPGIASTIDDLTVFEDDIIMPLVRT